MKKNTASQIIGAQLCSATDGSDFTSTVTCYVTGNGGTQALGSVGSGVCTHEGNGFHTYTPAQAETNYDHAAFTFKGTGAVTATVQVYPTFPQTGDNFALIGTTGSGLTSLASAANLATANTKLAFLPAVTAGAAGGVMIAGSNAATTVNITGNITGNLSGSVGSVTGAVGSVTGAVGSVTAGVTLAAATHTGAIIPTVTTLTNLPAITTGWLTATGIAASALNGKGDWNINKTGYSLTQSFPTNFSAMSITAGGLVDITQAAADKAWGTTARVLTAGTNIALAKGTGVTGFNDLDAAGVAAAAWNAATASYGIAGSYGLLVETNLDAAVSSVGGGGGGVADWTANEKTAIRAILGIPAAGTTPDDPTTGILDTIRDAVNVVDDFLDTEIAAIKAKTDNLPSDPADASDIAAAFTALSAKVDTVDDFLDTEMPALTVAVAAVKTKTDFLPSATAGASGGLFIAGTNAATTANITGNITGNLSGSVGSVTGAVGSVTGAVGSVTGHTPQTGDTYARLGAPAGASHAVDVAAVKTQTASIQADTDDIQTRLPAALVGGRMDSNLSAISNSTTTMAAFNRALKGNVIGTVGAASTTTSIVSSSLTPAGSVADKFKGRILTFADDTTTANLRGQATDITANTSAAAPTFTCTALTTAPVAGDTFSIT